MKNFKGMGDLQTFTAVAAVSSGDGVQIGQAFGVAQTDAAIGARFAMKMMGNFLLPKNNTEVFAEGALVYWDGTELTTTATGNLLVGYVVDAALLADTEATVFISPAPRPDEP